MITRYTEDEIFELAISFLQLAYPKASLAERAFLGQQARSLAQLVRDGYIDRREGSGQRVEDRLRWSTGEPMPRPSGDTGAIAPSSDVKVLVPCAWAFAISVRLRIEKSSSAPASKWWRSRRRLAIWRSARAVESAEIAPTMITPVR